jgi:hypothetical protein
MDSIQPFADAFDLRGALFSVAGSRKAWRAAMWFDLHVGQRTGTTTTTAVPKRTPAMLEKGWS